VTVVAGETETVAISVIPLSGDETLSLNLTWPSGILSSPTVEASLKPTNCGSAQSLSFTIAENSASYSSNSIAAGYYTLSLLLKEGTTVVAGKTDIIRILSNQTTSETYNFT